MAGRRSHRAVAGWERKENGAPARGPGFSPLRPRAVGGLGRVGGAVGAVGAHGHLDLAGVALVVLVEPAVRHAARGYERGLRRRPLHGILHPFLRR